MPGGKPMANTWQGRFPWEDLLGDGHEWTAPVGCSRPAARMAQPSDTSTCHLGFRCVIRSET